MNRAWMFTILLLAGCGNESGSTVECNGECPDPQPSTPRSITAEAYGTSVTIDWDPAKFADGYHLYYSSDEDFEIGNYAAYEHGTWVQGVTPPVEVTVPEGEPYFYFRVTAFASDESTPGAVTVETRFAPTDEGTVMDLDRSVEWKRCREGQSWDGATCAGEPSQFTSDEVLDTYDRPPRLGWRLPTGREFSAMTACDSDWCNDLWPDLGHLAEDFYLVHSESHPTRKCTSRPGGGSTACYPFDTDPPMLLSVILVRDVY